MMKTKDIRLFSAKKFQAELEKRYARHSAVIKALIEAGRGMETGQQTLELAEARGDALSIEYRDASKSYFDAHAERSDRLKYHGTLKPIRRKS